MIRTMFNATWSLLVLTYFCTSANAQQKPNRTTDIFSANKLLSRTINIGFAVNARQTGGGLSPVTMSDIQKIKQAGFNAVRLPVEWVSAMESQPPYLLDKNFLAAVDKIIGQILICKLAVIIDNHSDEEMMAEPTSYCARYLSLWRQLSGHYQRYPPEVMFELMAEPHGQLDNAWNDFLKASLDIVRLTNPGRPVIIGPVSSNRPQLVNSLVLPASDSNIIVTFHQYSPVRFTMQGEAWFPFGKPVEWLGTAWPAQNNDEAGVTQLMDIMSAWVEKNKRPVFLGEFGVSANADTASAVRWIRFNRQEAEKRGFSWGYWSTLGVHFSLIDPTTGDWRAGYLNALMPGIFHPAFNKKTDTGTNIRPATGITAQLVLEKCINAMGGRKAIAAIKDITLKGTALMNGATLTIDQTYLVPGIFSESVSANGNLYQHTLVKPGVVDVTLQGKRHEPTDTEIEMLQEKTEPFPEVLFLSNRYNSKLEGIVTENNEDFYEVKVISPMGREFVNYYSVRTNFRTKTTHINVTGAPASETVYVDYQRFGRVLLPVSVMNKTGPLTIEAHFKINLNTGVLLSDIH